MLCFNASNAMTSMAELHPIGGGLEIGEEISPGIDEIGSRPFSGSVTQPYRFSGNELYLSDGLGLYDFKARMYDPALGRFTSVDPLAEKYPGFSPYSYCAGNPINLVDPDGRIIGDPVKNPTIRHNRASNLYGENIRLYKGELRTHQGFDYSAPVGTDVMAVKEGVVYQVSDGHPSYGTTITIKHELDDKTVLYSFYAHLSDTFVKEGDSVSEGDVVALSGKTGNAAGQTISEEHLHFEVRSQPNNALGLKDKIDPNELVDTKFVSQDPQRKPQTSVGVIKIEKDGTQTKMDIN